jgi:hypothetical protein
MKNKEKEGERQNNKRKAQYFTPPFFRGKR